MDKTGLERIDYTTIILVVVTALLVVLTAYCSTRMDVKRVNGMPLDAMSMSEYDRPVWLPDCEHAYKVYDRQTGDAWWLLETEKGYVTLPLEADER